MSGAFHPAGERIPMFEGHGLMRCKSGCMRGLTGIGIRDETNEHDYDRGG